MAEIKIEQDGVCSKISVDGQPLRSITRIAVEMMPLESPVVTLEMHAFEHTVELSDARLKISGIEAPEALERAMLDYLRFKYPEPHEEGGPVPPDIRAAMDEALATVDPAALRTMAADLVRLPVRETTPDRQAPAGVTRIAAEGERLGRLGWTPGA